MSYSIRPLAATVILVIAILLPMVASGPAHACSCAPSPGAEEVLAAAPVAFIGTQVGRSADTGSSDFVVLTLSVSEVYNGQVGTLVEVMTAPDSAACGVDFAGQGPVGLYPSDQGRGFEVSLCGGAMSADDMRQASAALGIEPTGPVSDAEPEPATTTTTTSAVSTTVVESAPVAPTDTGAPALLWLGAVIAAVAVAAVGFLTARRRR